ncbi:bifunctional uroporphyrinogen-III C-methyltransferase/uroporphyrinogen-III synthase [Pseudonocardia charpentierae]|jgi:uroporphyrinogen III methyltransferase/synthase|uniref:uroporphyrinogen-III C-methyltransferase n=1 Tax=Pseudonocardia charpentierae TaxID=3075545 RepID=A0ABU2N743_9PSEU|nr:bifunctional uroporphyrinogen-III C-methyltransferase/uroporphyrinogen-III synthase [Pseudonocardia sp. DSM 45834]MDT0348504.1 bifunctional uroporphyrinogen-III C-methyltransferase/uroporphyrinogen-III synthase [Pseudonocardia sp. DSM 45834]HSU07736.1 bifunctional uroporphyrinogen-III C-methyltransferase/uroporphyrinogen-III synthase [Pseudonocardia sp.]
MNRAPSTPGRIAFVGSGPGDPGLLTVRARDAIAGAPLVVTDPDVAEGVLALVADGADIRPAVGEPADVAAGLVAEAAAGRQVVRLVGGDPLTADAVVAETLAVAAAGVPFDVVPGVGTGTAVPAYAGVPLGSAHVEADVRAGLDWAALAAVPGPLVLHATAAHLLDVVTGLTEHGVAPTTPVAVTSRGTLTAQKTVQTTLAALASEGADLDGPLVVTIGDAVAQRDRLSWWESRALYGWRVLVPRTKDQAGVMSDRLAVHGATAEEVPTIAVEPPRSPTQMERAVKGLVDGRYQWVVFTSTNAVRAVWEKFAEFGLDARAFSGVKIACVGASTAEKVRAFGIVPDLVPTVPEQESSSEGLLGIFPPHDDVLDPVDRVLLPRADIATETLAAGLRDRGWEIDDVTAYRTVRAAPPPAPIREAIKTGGFDAVCFTSSSTVRNLVGIAGKPHARTIVACIGPQTAETAREFGLRVDVQPEEARVPALVDALAAHAARLRAEGALPPPRKAKIRRR